MAKRSATMSAVVLVATATVLMLAACQGQEGASPTPTGPFNDTDVRFAQQMIVHHQQAVMMAEMAQTYAQNPRVKQLAQQIEAERDPPPSETEPSKDCLTSWFANGSAAHHGTTASKEGQSSRLGRSDHEPCYSGAKIIKHRYATMMTLWSMTGSNITNVARLAQRRGRP